MVRVGFTFKVILAVLLSVITLYALPILQLDVSGGTYESTTETIMAQSNDFTLYALLDKSVTQALNGTYSLWIALTPPTMSADDAAQAGSFMFNGEEKQVNEDMTYGIPDLASHGIYATYYMEYSFMFSPAMTASWYNVEENAGGFHAENDGEGALYYKAFSFDISGLGENYGLHFDLTGEYEGMHKNYVFAPFSHDAGAGNGSRERVPEPSALLLLGIALSCVAFFRKHLSDIS